MTEEQKAKCHKIIHLSATGAAGIGSGLAQLPTSDAIPLSALQIKMIIDIARVFGKSVTQSGAEGLLASQFATVCGRGISQWLVGWIPGWGNAVNAATAAAVTEGIGWAAVKYFDDGISEQKFRKADPSAYPDEDVITLDPSEFTESRA